MKGSRSLLEHLQYILTLFSIVGFPLPHTQALYDWERKDYCEGVPYLLLLLFIKKINSFVTKRFKLQKFLAT
jgi:hypothetical protein